MAKVEPLTESERFLLEAFLCYLRGDEKDAVLRAKFDLFDSLVGCAKAKVRLEKLKEGDTDG
jgi:hypothetical protein